MLNDLEFDSVWEIRAGAVIERRDLYAPTLYDGNVEGPWELISGYSGQDRYPGPIMHNSEFLGGRMESDIRRGGRDLYGPGRLLAGRCRW